MIAVLVLLAGCSPVAVLNALIPAKHFSAEEGLTYGPLTRQKLDVYRPHTGTGLAPVVVFFYGGRWRWGSREQYRFVGDALTSRGFVAIVPDYRLYPEVKFPAFVEDGALAVQWVREHARRFGGDPERIYLMGHSAGAHIAALLTLDESYLGTPEAGGKPVRGMVGLAGPYDFLPFTDDDVRALMGPPAGWPATQPINFVDGSEPPMLLLQGTGDSTVKPRNAARLAARIREAGGCVREVRYPGVGHIEIVLALFEPLRYLAPVLDDAADFLDAIDARAGRAFPGTPSPSVCDAAPDPPRSTARPAASAWDRTPVALGERDRCAWKASCNAAEEPV